MGRSRLSILSLGPSLPRKLFLMSPVDKPVVLQSYRAMHSLAWSDTRELHMAKCYLCNSHARPKVLCARHGWPAAPNDLEGKDSSCLYRDMLKLGRLSFSSIKLVAFLLQPLFVSYLLVVQRCSIIPVQYARLLACVRLGLYAITQRQIQRSGCRSDRVCAGSVLAEAYSLCHPAVIDLYI